MKHYTLRMRKLAKCIQFLFEIYSYINGNLALRRNITIIIIRPHLACQNGHHLMSVLLYRMQNSAIMAGLSKRTSFDVRFALQNAEFCIVICE